MAEKKIERRGLGRGLSALMADVPVSDANTESGPRQLAETSLAIDLLRPNPNQPRRKFSEDRLAELARSIEEKGIIQPLIVRRLKGNQYEIVAGERRWRAAQIARLHEVPVVVRDYDDTEVLEVAIMENIQRADLNPVEEAAGYRQLIERFGHTQEKVADALGKSRSYIANSMRLLTLPVEVQDMLEAGDLSVGHARALITSDDAATLAKTVVGKGLSVRETEKLTKPKDKPADKPTRKATTKDADTKALERDLSAATGFDIEIIHKPGGESGQLRISYKTLDDLDDLCRLLSRGR